MANYNIVAPKGFEGNAAFGNYFKARWQNFQNIRSNASFYADMPSEWIAYQNAYVRSWEQWASGFVLGLHDGNFFSTGMGKTVCDILAKECTKGGYRFEGTNSDSTVSASEWAKNNCCADRIQEGFWWANAIGNVLVRLNVGADELYPTIHPVNACYFELNRKEQCVRAKFYDTLTNGTADNSQSSLVVVEERILYQGAPYSRLKLRAYSGTATTPNWQDNVELERLSKWAKGVWQELYGERLPNVWYKLPFKTLGVYNWQNTATSSAVSQMVGFSDSSLHTSEDILYAIDYNYSQGQLDQYWGRTRVIVPKTMEQRPQRVLFNGEDYGTAMQLLHNPPLASDVYDEAPGSGLITDHPQQPLFIQPSLRDVERRALHDHYLQMLAAKVGLSSTTLANHLTYNHSKTATQVEYETDTTDETVESKRTLANIALNAMLRDVCEFYGWDEVRFVWNTSGTRNRKELLDEYARGLIPLDECIKKLHPELTEEAVTEWIGKLKAEHTQAISSANYSDFGLGDEW